MRTVVLTMPDEPDAVPGWLERELVGANLPQLVAELGAVHDATGCLHVEPDTEVDVRGDRQACRDGPAPQLGARPNVDQAPADTLDMQIEVREAGARLAIPVERLVCAVVSKLQVQAQTRRRHHAGPDGEQAR